MLQFFVIYLVLLIKPQVIARKINNTIVKKPKYFVSDKLPINTISDFIKIKFYFP